MQASAAPAQHGEVQLVKLLSLDIGITTGYCVQTKAGKVLDIGTIQWKNTEFTRQFIKQILADKTPDATLLEMPVIIRGPLGVELKQVCDAITGLALPRASYVTPSQWKGTKEAKLKVPVDYPVTVHERDAYRMGRYWLQSGQGSC
jgi:hypothetical protein